MGIEKMDESSEELLLEEISSQIRKGFTSGFHPYWELIAGPDVLEDPDTMTYIADLVKDGYREGYHPRWVIKHE